MKRFGKALLYPPMAIVWLLTPIALFLLIYAMVRVGTQTPTAMVSYILSAYTLTLWCVRLPRIIIFFKNIKRENRLVRRWLSDERLRVNVSLYSALCGNVAYAILQLWLGLFHASFWFYSLAAYYICLSVMRFFLVRYIKKNKPGERVAAELVRYRACGYVFLFMNLALSVMIFFMVHFDRTFHHNEITTIALAAYTFTALTLSIIHIIKYRKYQSPAYSASRAIGLAAACVSMLTLEATMLTTFGEAEGHLFRRWMLALSGSAVSAVIILMSVGMIVQGTKKLKLCKTKEIPHGT